jgi:hypothetical protein
MSNDNAKLIPQLKLEYKFDKGFMCVNKDTIHVIKGITNYLYCGIKGFTSIMDVTRSLLIISWRQSLTISSCLCKFKYSWACIDKLLSYGIVTKKKAQWYLGTFALCNVVVAIIVVAFTCIHIPHSFNFVVLIVHLLQILNLESIIASS